MIDNIYIVIVLLGLIYYILEHITSYTKRDAWQWWLTPWIAMAYTGIMFAVYYYVEIPDIQFLRMFFPEEYQLEAGYSLLCICLWRGIALFALRDDTVHKACIDTFRSIFANSRDDKDKVLPFPYFIDEEAKVRAKVGQAFYRWTMKSLAFTVALIYAVQFLLLRFQIIDEFYLQSAFGIMGLLPLLEYYIYLCAGVPLEKENTTDNEKRKSDFDELWQLYVDTFDNYSVAWKKTLSERELNLTKEWAKDNDDDLEDMMKDFMDVEKCSNAIIEKYDIVTAFIKLEPIFDYVEKNGRHVLIAIDIPNHFTKNKKHSYADDIAGKLQETLRKNFSVYGERSAQAALSSSIVIASLSRLTRQGMSEDWTQWMRKIGLIVVVGVFDKGVANMYECRRFSYVLQTVNKDYQIIFVTAHRNGMEPSLRNTWLTTINTTEKKMRQFPHCKYQYFIAYDFEDFWARFGKVLTAKPSEPLYSGSELATLALSSTIGDKQKVVTPVNYLDLAYSNAIEGKEELNKFSDLIVKDCLVAKMDINDHMVNHLLPVVHVGDSQVLSVIYDVDNNSPAIYSKWVHMGYERNFSIVVSKPYLFRDYFNANHDYFVAAPFVASQPQLCKSRLTLAIILLELLQKADMEEKALRDLLTYYYDESEIVSVAGVIRQLFATYFSHDLASMLMTSDETVFANGNYHHLIRYNLSQLTDANVPAYLDVITVKDESGNVLFDILYDLVYQNYDCGQTHSFSGKPYIIKDINRTTRTLDVSSGMGSTIDVLFYKPLHKISFVGTKRNPIKEMSHSTTRWRHPVTGQFIYVNFVGFEANVTIDTIEWYEFHRYTIDGYMTKEASSPQRSYPFGKVLRLTFGFLQKPEYRQRIDDIRRSLQVLLYEAMQSVFPHHAQYLIITSIGEGDDDLPWIFPSFECSDECNDHELTFYFIEDAHVDLGLIGALAVDSKNVWYLLQQIYDYLIWLTEDNALQSSDAVVSGDVASWLPENYDEYIVRPDLDKYAFLKYGRKKLPAYFDVDLMINFIKDLFQKQDELQQTNIERQTRNSIFGTCDFCGKKMPNKEMQRLDDGRMRCPDCSVDTVDTDEDFRQLCDKVKEAFMQHLGIDFSSITYNGRLVSAVELHKQGGYFFSVTNGYDVRKLIGLARDTKVDEFYVENGYKRDKTFGIIAHEMTHIWEYNNEDFKKVRKTNEDLVEGLAVWTDLFLCEKSGMTNAAKQRNSWLARDDEYGRGLRFIMENCPDDPYGYIQVQASKMR